MNLEVTLGTLVAENMRTWMFSILGQMLAVFLCCIMLEKRKNPIILMVWLIIKTLLGTVLLKWMVLLLPCEGAERFLTFPIFFWMTFFTIFLFCVVFQGGVLKVMMAMLITEVMISILVLPGAMAVNLLEGREVLTTFSGAFEPTDLLAWVISWGLVALLSPVARPFLKKYRNYQPKHRKLLAVLVGTYFLSAQILDGQWFQEQVLFDSFFILFHLVCVGGIILLIWCWNRRSQIRIQREQEFLHFQMRLMEDHYGALQQQIARMDHSRKIIDGQMEELMRVLEQEPVPSEKKDRSSRIEAYLGELRKAYEEIRTGIYCRDWLVDAVLCCQEENARRRGIEVEYHIQGYDRGSIAEEDLAELLFGLLDFGVRQNAAAEKKEMSLRLGCVKDRLALEFYTAAGNRVRFPKRLTADCMKKYEGTLQKRKEKSGMQILLTLKR